MEHVLRLCTENSPVIYALRTDTGEFELADIFIGVL